MDINVIEIKINEYVGEKSPQLFEVINEGNNLLIQAPTGSGKSWAVIVCAKAIPNKRIAFLCPTRTLVDNLSESESTIGIPCGYGHDFINQNKRSSVIISTYDSIRLLEGIEILVIDEAHLLAGHSGFREVLSDLLKFHGQTIMISATPEIIEDLPNFRRVNFIRKPRAKFIEVARSNQAPIQTAINIIEDNNRDSSKLTIIRLNNKDTCKKYTID